MQDYRLRERLAELKGALSLLETSLEESADLPERLADLRRVIGNTRKSLWAVITAANSEDYNKFISEFRLRRASETLRSVERDLVSGTISGQSRDLDQLAVNLIDVLDAVPRFIKETSAVRTVFTVK